MVPGQNLHAWTLGDTCGARCDGCCCCGCWFFGVLSLVLLAVGSYVTGYFACKIMPLGKAIADPPVRTLSDIRATTILMQVTIVMAAILVTANILLPLARGISLSTARELALEAWENGGVLPRIVAVAVNVTISFSLMMIVDRIDIKGRFPFLLVLLFVALTIAA